MAVVPPEERSAAGGFTGVARTTGAAVSPLLAGFLFARPSLINIPFFIAGALKILYDLLLYRGFCNCSAPRGSDSREMPVKDFGPVLNLAFLTVYSAKLQ